jgi:geranylgeranyl reductase family protein
VRGYDVAVVGGGPAGSRAAAVLANSGLKVLIIDPLSSMKPCGGYLSAKALRQLAPDLIADILPRPVQTVRLLSSGSGSMVVRSRQPLGYMFRRETLDCCLLAAAEAAGAELWRRQRATQFRQTGESVEIITDKGQGASARYLVGADGVHGKTSVQAGVRGGSWPRWQLAYARVAELRLPDGAATLDQSEIQLVCLPIMGGFGWIFPLPGGVNVGVAGSSLELPRIESHFATLLQQLQAKVGHSELSWQRGWWLPAGGFPRRIATARTLLVGDAAGFVDSFSGEGIYYALLSGQLAAQAIVRHFGEANRVMLDYRRQCGRLIMPTLRRSLLLSSSIGRHKERYYQALLKQPELATHLLSLMREDRPYHGRLAVLLQAFFLARLWPAEQAEDVEVFGTQTGPVW